MGAVWGRSFPPDRSVPSIPVPAKPQISRDMATGHNLCLHVGVGAPPILVYFSGDWDVHWGYGILTHGMGGP